MYDFLFYADVKLIILLATAGLIITSFIAVKCGVVFKASVPAVVVISLGLIFYNTAFGRQTSDIHRFMLIADYNGGFWREMLMNALLFFPLGISLPYLFRSYKFSVVTGFLISLVIELWQYFAGTGLAQGTDVIMNTLGMTIGGLSYMWSQRRNDRNN